VQLRVLLAALAASAFAVSASDAAGALPAAAPVMAPFLEPTQIAALADELSGDTAKRNLEGLARFHRQRGSEGFHAAAEFIAERARAYGLQVEILRFPADGAVRYGTQRSRPGWDIDSATLVEIGDRGSTKLADAAAAPIVLAEDSESADVTAALVDVGDGTREADYAGKDVTGRIVLAAQQPGAVAPLAVAAHGAVGIVSYAQNQKTAWSGDDDTLIRWGHLDTFSSAKTFAFMVSLKSARSLKARLAQGETIRLRARVKAGQHPGAYEIVTATLPGTDPRADQEIAFSCHLDHQRPGANDNASGCVTILEVARTLAALIESGRLPRPARTIRFLWPPEIEGTTVLLNARPDYAHRIRAVIHMDMVGGGPDTMAVFHVTRGPRSLPSFVHDVAWAFASWVNTETYAYAATGEAEYPLTAGDGGKDPLRAEYSPYSMGSDHEVYQDSSFHIPAIYLNDWPDRYIHTDHDTAAHIDPTKLQRAAFIGAASGLVLANFAPRDVPAAERAVAAGGLLRTALAMDRRIPDRAVADYERAVRASIAGFGLDTGPQRVDAPAARPGPIRRYRRRSEPRGPLVVFGYDYFADHARAAGLATPALLTYGGAWGSGEEYAYEALNFADGTRTVGQITEELSAEYGPVPLDLVSEYLKALSQIGIVD
jgi:hypothetical protein